MSKVILVTQKGKKIYFANVLWGNFCKNKECKLEYVENGNKQEITVKNYISKQIGETCMIFES
ncbi:MAG: hypothetical protein ACRC0V_10515 [Fusobacteriaceae bacterium]